MKYKNTIIFAVLSLIWGSSFFWIKIALREVTPDVLVALRLLIGLIGLCTILAFKRQSVRLTPRAFFDYAIMGVFNCALPFLLISWGEKHISSGLAAILNGTQPLFTLVFAHLLLSDEKISFVKFLGLVLGFLGVAILVGDPFHGESSSVCGVVAVLAATASYALTAIFLRLRLKHDAPLVQSALMLVFADAFAWITVAVQGHWPHLPQLALTRFAVLWLGLFGTCIAFVLYYYLIGVWGTTRASLVTYVYPVFSVILGTLVLGEAVNINFFAGVLLIAAGIAATNMKMQNTKTALVTIVD